MFVKVDYFVEEFWVEEGFVVGKVEFFYVGVGEEMEIFFGVVGVFDVVCVCGVEVEVVGVVVVVGEVVVD